MKFSTIYRFDSNTFKKYMRGYCYTINKQNNVKG